MVPTAVVTHKVGDSASWIHLPADLPELVGRHQAGMYPLCLMLRQHEPAAYASLVTAEEHTVQQGYPSDLSKPMPMGEDDDPGGTGGHSYSTLAAGVICTMIPSPCGPLRVAYRGWPTTGKRSALQAVNPSTMNATFW